MNRTLTFRRVLLILCFWPFITIWKLFGYLREQHNLHQNDNAPPRTQELSKSTALQPVVRRSESSITASLRVPEPTLSLLFITDEDPKKIQSPMGITIRLNVNVSTGTVDVNQEEKGFYAEPSLIWTKLAVKPNDDLEGRAMYWPVYAQFTPEHRYQYLHWLKDIEQPTNLSYVFLYFYGLERHMLVGNYDGAVDEILRLLKAHDKSSFRSYAARSLIVASLVHNRLDIIERAPFLLEEEVDEALALRIVKGTTMSPEDIISIASRVGFTNKRYIKLHPERFKHHLQMVIDEFETEHGKVLSIFKLSDFKKANLSVFANMSIPEAARQAQIPQILEDHRFQAAMRNALQEAHNRVKAEPH